MPELRAGELWEAALGAIQKEVSLANYTTWLKDSRGLAYQENLLVISVPDAFTAEWLSQRMLSLLKKALLHITGQELDIEIRLETAPTPKSPLLYALNPGYTFDSFVPGPCNQLAYLSAKRMAQDPFPSYNPLFVFAGIGLGKTHLLQAIAHGAWSQGWRIAYVHAEDFTNDFVTSMERRQAQEFRRRYRTLDLLIVDDIHFLSGKTRTEEGFLYTFNELQNRSRRIVVSSDRPPQQVPLCAELRSRFQGGLAAELQPPDRQTRLAIAQKKAQQHHITLDPEALEFLIAEGPQNIREIEGSLNLVLAQGEAMEEPVNLELIKSILSEKAEPSPIQKIIQAVAHYLHLPVNLLLQRSRQPRAVLGRQFIIFLLRERLGLTMQQISNQIGLAKSSVIYNYEKLVRLLPQQPDLEKALFSITARIDGLKVEKPIC